MAKFPCPYCKGKYSWVEPVLDDGSGPEYSCGFCDEGMIEIGSAKHLEIKRANPPKEFLLELVGELRGVLLEVVGSLKKPPEGGWSERERLLASCCKALDFDYEPDCWGR